ALHEESLSMRRQIGDRQGIAYSLEGFANLDSRRRPERATRLWGAAQRLREEMDAPLPASERQRQERDEAAAREALGEKAFPAAWAEGGALSLEEAIQYALSGED